MSDGVSGKTIVVVILVILIVAAGGLAFVIYLRKKRKARESARQKLLEDQTKQVTYDSTSPEYRNLYKKALLKASQDEAVAPPSISSSKSRDLESQSPASSRTVAATDRSPQSSPRPDLADSDIASIAIGSWYEHLIRHANTEYLRSMLKQHPGVSEKDLVPEMRLLLEHCPNVPLVRWSKLSTDDKTVIAKRARDIKDLITANLNRRLRQTAK